MLMTPSLYAANSRMESLKSSINAVFITPFVNSLELAFRKRGGNVAIITITNATISITYATFIIISSFDTFVAKTTFITINHPAITVMFLQHQHQSGTTTLLLHPWRTTSLLLDAWCTWKSNRASSWFWMMGRVLISFSVVMVRITPSTLSMIGDRVGVGHTRVGHTHTNTHVRCTCL